MTQVITAIQLEPQDSYEERKFRNGEELDTSTLQVGKVMEQSLFPEMVKSAEQFAILNKGQSADSLFDQLLNGTIDENGLQAGLNKLFDIAEQKEGATEQDAQNLLEEIKQAAARYEQKKAEQEQSAEKKKAVQGAFANARGELSSILGGK